ncbi:Glycogen synthase [Komagataella phaffii CBS 7435]|uniref:Glycogen [starch] synthase n=2 Tax=Komagataella phaffii TaxID=460519 RepID=C4R5J9_KOMPG|nr:Glycogen synthase, similar to Gsy1p [Komagataella phaffii GS115]AOA64228.1 GQ67_03881T0 [Komagataella phaffii]CAH2449380.1 Glycogen synthase [Komagataella phaffii CBS 7435]AOA69354.1 GQ68_03855T0 [Komagataella phaffii GS115]CAY70835.1 Glycogen synthase, similar to Gsy1p [Komagataella phaffii GS115]CCA39374.1 Glycogen synthase [Komagataella phaffii CBS 7435]
MGKDITNHLLFEIATEVANRVGGIYSVLKSKAPVTVAEYKDRYTLIGPLNANSANVEVEELPVLDPVLKRTLDSMSGRGIRYLYGRWLIEGAPRVILFDIGSAAGYLNEWKSDLWNIAGVPTPEHDVETNDAILLGYLVAWFLGELVHNDGHKRAIICHAHEWLAAVCLPLCRKRKIDVTTVFTTHATLLGRYLCAGSVDFYNNLDKFDVDAEAGKRGIYHRYCIERAAAHSADVFTTVSHITAYEAEHLLKRKPDGVLPNGLNVIKFQAVHEFQNLHAEKKEKINEFIRGHFYGQLDFKLNNTLYFFIAGRYEYRNKGVDFFIESLARLNHRLKASNSNMTVVAFIIMPAKTNSYTVETLKGQAVIKQLENTINDIEALVGKRLFEFCQHPATSSNSSHIEMPDIDDLLKPSDRVLLKRRMFAMKREGLPPIVTHNMADDSTDPILNQIRNVQLFNRPEDRVKIIFHPEFLNSNNPILSLDYDEFVRGCHLGVFPSYYEPWGYTPAECTVMGIPSITTNLSGFGCYMEDLIENSSDYGIYIVDRRLKSVDESIDQLTSYMFDFVDKTRRQRINQRNRVERLSDLLDWRRMGLEYVKGRSLALRRAYPDEFKNQNNEHSNPFSESNSIKITRPLSVPGSPRDKYSSSANIMTPGDLGTLQENNSTDYISWRLGNDTEEDGLDVTLRGLSVAPSAEQSGDEFDA